MSNNLCCFYKAYGQKHFSKLKLRKMFAISDAYCPNFHSISKTLFHKTYRKKSPCIPYNELIQKSFLFKEISSTSLLEENVCANKFVTQLTFSSIREMLEIRNALVPCIFLYWHAYITLYKNRRKKFTSNTYIDGLDPTLQSLLCRVIEISTCFFMELSAIFFVVFIKLFVYLEKKIGTWLGVS